MDYDKMREDLRIIELGIWHLSNLKDTECEAEAEAFVRELKKEAERLRKLIGEEEEREYQALCREYERNAL